MKKGIIYLFLFLVIIGVLIYILKDYLFGCKWCVSEDKTFIVEAKNLIKSAEEKNKTDEINLFCKDSNEIDLYNLSDNKSINYYLEFNNNLLIKMVVYDSKNELIISKENNNGIKIKDIIIIYL